MKSMKLNLITKLMLLMLTPMVALSEEAVDFNTDFIDSDGKENVDFSKFSHANYVPPGDYSLAIEVNRAKVSMEQPITFFNPNYDDKISLACVTPEIYALLGLKKEWDSQVKWLDDGKCLDIRSVPDMTIQGDLAKNVVEFNIPQAYMEYSDPDWDPPSRWDDGIMGAFIDYNATGRVVNKQTGDKAVITSVMDYNRNNLNIDLKNVPDNAEALQSTQYATLTEGAIGYRKFNVITGQKVMGIISLADGDYPPFGASVKNAKKIEVGIISDKGFVYLAGVNPSESLDVVWGDDASCHIQLPEKLDNNMEHNVLLPCK
ncbi:TPA: FimD/PapC N-terminal domain-containing protein [Providencia alcalifaciens]